MVSVMCRSETSPNQIGAIDFLKETWQKTERMAHDFVRFSMGQCLFGMIFDKPKGPNGWLKIMHFSLDGLFGAHGKYCACFLFSSSVER